VNPPAETFDRDRGLASRDIELGWTFRDPAGQLHLTPRHALRRIRPAAVDEVRAFLASPLRAALEKSGDLIPSQAASPASHSLISAGEFWLEHPRIDPITYPWEWTAGQWRAAAELTLGIASQAIRAGWTLKDATPLNVVFDGPRPILVDVLSFERRDPNSSLWFAYGQFVRTFLLPLVAAKYLSWPLQATLLVRDGYEPGEIYRALKPWQRFHPDLLDVVTLATLLDRPGKARNAPAAPSKPRDPELNAHILQKRIARLGRQIRRAANLRNGSQWSEYTQHAVHYHPADVDRKQQFVKDALLRLHPEHVLDIGANTGMYALLAAEAGAHVVAVDSDAAALESLWQSAAQNDQPITVLVANVARPTPAAGWCNREHFSLLDRLNGNFDLVLMLAVVHHLILREQLPLAHIADLCASLTRRWLVLEWVPPSDPMYQEWLRGRGDLYGHFTEDDLKRAFEPCFAIVDRTPLNNGRVLFLFERTSLPADVAPAAGTSGESAA